MQAAFNASSGDHFARQTAWTAVRDLPRIPQTVLAYALIKQSCHARAQWQLEFYRVQRGHAWPITRRKNRPALQTCFGRRHSARHVHAEAEHYLHLSQGQQPAGRKASPAHVLLKETCLLPGRNLEWGCVWLSRAHADKFTLEALEDRRDGTYLLPGNQRGTAFSFVMIGGPSAAPQKLQYHLGVSPARRMYSRKDAVRRLRAEKRAPVGHR